ncbi:MAG TPA: aminotransferase DegT [Bacteroidales bacterium]|nr:aminotransferase DegT [Bacteroidales bacterium]
MIPLFKPYMPKHITDGLNEILYSGKLTYGQWGRTLEKEIQTYLGTEKALVVNNYASALNVALSALGVRAGDEVIASPVCCLQSSQPLAVKGLKVVWADVEPKTGTLSPDSVKEKITARTKAIMHNQHLGYAGYIDEINAIAHSAGIFTIDDCTDGMGIIYKGKKVGNCGSDATVISMQAVRLPNAIEGGIVVLNDKKHFDVAKKARDLGVDRSVFRDSRGEISPQCDITSVGYAALMNEVNAYIALKQMPELESLLNQQRENANHWKEKIKNDGLNCTPLFEIENTLPNYWVFGLLTNKKNELIDYFRDKGYYASSVHLNNNNYSLFGKQDELKGVNEFYNKFFAVPCGWWM